MELIQQGVGWIKAGEAPEAVIEEALDLLKSAEDKQSRAAWLVVLAEARVAVAEAEDAADAACQAAAIFRELGMRDCEAAAASALVSALTMRQDWDGAVLASHRELEACKFLKDQAAEAQATLRLAQAQIPQMKDPFAAAQTAILATNLFRRIHDRQGELLALQATAEAHLMHDPEKALEAAKEALALCDELSNLKAKALVQQYLAAAKLQIATLQNAQQAQSLSSRGDQYVPYKWPRPLQQRGKKPEAEVSSELVVDNSGRKQVAGKPPATQFVRKAFKWVAPNHATDEAWYCQELRLLQPKPVA